MANKKKVNLAAQKAKKQKMILGVGGAILVLALAIQAPRILKIVHGGGGESTAAPYKAFPNAAPEAAPVAVSGSGKVVLQDLDQQPEASVGQLVDFELFSSKDPFVQQVELSESGQDSDSDPKQDGTGKSGDEPDQTEAGGGDTQEEAAAPTSADISVNGVSETVQVKAEFPSGDPAFVLVSATKSTVRIGIAGGSLATGDDTVTLRRGKTLTLVNTVDGTEYHLRLVSLS